MFGEHDVTLVHSGPAVCSSVSGAHADLSKHVAAVLAELKVNVILDDKVTFNAKSKSLLSAIPIKDGTVKTKKGVEIKATEAFWCGGNAYAGAQVFDMLSCAQNGRFEVDDFLQVKNQTRVFAAGEIANVGAHAYGADEAATMGKTVAANVAKLLAGKPPTATYRAPVENTLYFALGPKRGVAQIPAKPGCFGTKGGVFSSGPLADRKNTDHSYCARYWEAIGSQHLPEMRPF